MQAHSINTQTQNPFGAIALETYRAFAMRLLVHAHTYVPESEARDLPDPFCLFRIYV